MQNELRKKFKQSIEQGNEKVKVSLVIHINFVDKQNLKDESPKNKRIKLWQKREDCLKAPPIA